MKKYIFNLVIATGFIAFLFFAIKSDRSSKPKEIISIGNSIGGTQGIQNRRAWELLRQRDPATGRIPRDIFKSEQAYAKTLPSDAGFMEKSMTWIPRGPYNVGGRTRGAAIDITDEKTIIAGGVSGGVWKTSDGGYNWAQVVASDQLHNVTTLTQDTRPGHTNNWYFGTGEYYGNSAGAYGADFLGNGIYKSTDNGANWFSLPATASNTPETMDSSWDYVWRVAVDPSNLSNDVVYAAIYKGIYRSTDGGNTWTRTIMAGLGSSSFFTDVAVTSQGVVYATINRGGARRNIWRSTDGINWANITPSTFPLSFRRVVIGINPQNENEVYFFAHTPGSGQISTTFTNETEGNSLFKYTYISGDGSGTGGVSVNLSSNLPNNGSTTFDNLYVQGSYDMVIAVKPNDSNTVFLGGTNIYRSTDGFTSMTNTRQIGGYRIGSYFPDWDVYKNHHPDQHGMAFLPSNPDKLITFNDGGLYQTDNCMADTVVWHRLNNGYRNSQPYTVAFNKFQNNDILLGGFQDNGNYFTNSADPFSIWKMSLNGDGAYNAISNDGSTYYLSIQQGKLFKMNLDNTGTATAFNRIDPTGGVPAGYMFINPFVLDPNNNDIMYVPCNKTIWRNNSLSQIPLNGNYDTISTGWSKYSFLASWYINAIAVSTTPANRLYYGTLDGLIYRADSANIGNPTVTNILTHANLSTSCISVDPNDADKVLVVYSNYKAYSLYFTDNGGQAWKKVSGNLEQFDDGSGNGPSCRWASLLHIGNKTLYFVGTSVGLFATDTLIDNGTTWTNIAANTIGNVIVDMVETRNSDGLVVVATHGNGIYSAHITSVDVILGKPEERNFFANEPIIFPNPAIDHTYIKLFLSKSTDIKIQIYDMTGKIVDEKLQKNNNPGENIISVNTSNYKSGRYFCKIISDGNKSKVVSFTVIR